MNQIIGAAENIEESLEYQDAKRLFIEKKELQARLSEVNKELRTLQERAGCAVDLAKEKFKREIEINK